MKEPDTIPRGIEKAAGKGDGTTAETVRGKKQAGPTVPEMGNGRA